MGMSHSEHWQPSTLGQWKLSTPDNQDGKETFQRCAYFDLFIVLGHSTSHTTPVYKESLHTLIWSSQAHQKTTWTSCTYFAHVTELFKDYHNNLMTHLQLYQSWTKAQTTALFLFRFILQHLTSLHHSGYPSTIYKMAHTNTHLPTLLTPL